MRKTSLIAPSLQHVSQEQLTPAVLNVRLILLPPPCPLPTPPTQMDIGDSVAQAQVQDELGNLVKRSFANFLLE